MLLHSVPSLDFEDRLLTVQQGTDLRHLSFRTSALKAILMAVGGLILGLGFALIWTGPSIPSLIYDANSLGFTEPISVSEAMSIGFWFIWTGIILFPVGLATLVYGIGAQKSPPETVSPEKGV